MRALLGPLLVASLLGGSLMSVSADSIEAPGDLIPEGRVSLQVGDLTATVIDNAPLEEHAGRYNGLTRVVHAAGPESFFVPTYAGLNFEHLYDAETDGFSPREGAYGLRRLGPTAVALYRPAAEEPHWQVESLSTFTCSAPSTIDFEFACVPRRQDYAGGFLGAFWASYIDAPLVRSIYFLGRRAGTDEPPRWVTAYSPEHGVQSCHLHEADPGDCSPRELPVLASLERGRSPYEFTEWFYYGRSGSLVWIMMFDPGSLDEGERLRFAQSPTGGGGRNPAWDFCYLIKGPQAGRRYGFRARAVLKPFAGSEDVIREYERWLGLHVPRPSEPEPEVGELDPLTGQWLQLPGE
ncbi:MAG: hypothetical protein FJX74_15525 [Armatimonadetes bacterium]|nr:hypothetical protein [Armatimonadota bacterium]